MDSEEVQCPVCSHVFNAEDACGFVTYWGEDGAKPAECPACGIELLVTENVTRTYDVQVAALPQPSTPTEAE